MKNLFTCILVFAFVSGSLFGQNVLFSENFNSFQGFGDRVPGWQGGVGFRVYIGHGVGQSPTNKGLGKSFSANAPLDSIATPWFGPVQSNSVLTFNTRSTTYIGTSPSFTYRPTASDQFFLLGAAEDDSLNYLLLKDLKADYQAAQGLGFFTVNESLNSFAGKRMKVKFKSRCASTENPWQDIDNVEVTSVTHVRPGKQTDGGFEISPNPGNGLFKVQLGKEKTRNYKLFNALGSLIEEGSLTQFQDQLDFRQQHKGIYFLRIGETTRRIIIR